MNKFLLLMSLYLLGYAREASGQPDELPGSMNHKASVQQLSGEYFPLANPPDAEALYESSNDNTLSEHGSSEHGSNEHNVAEHSSGEHATGEHTSVEHSTSEQASGEHNAGEQSSVEHSAGEQSSGEHVGEQSSVEHSAGEQSSGEHVEQPSGEHTAGEQPSGEQPSGEQPSGEQASGEQPSGAPISSTSSGVLLNCHTCAYMNDQGKCLRGEGICTTQNSQQCMLKKIFEGGKLQFMVQGCENMCPSMNLFSHGTRMQIICCRNRPFCNKI
ncbi:acrosomal protein SP-10 isoform X1 [Otolemur garnettii]|uniref:acrosomal protein SP-10 isoform X1 n=1 Tax=Otolemur garnettii TaxID=30611 RepID=UPI00064424B6|nr:acrosomal protein SP-10 isoform X1 [Otolemur garnettii]